MSIEGIFLSPASSKPMQSIQQGQLIAGKGLDGDRYCNSVGTYSLFRSSRLCMGEPEPGRQLTLISADSVEAAFDRNQLPRLASWGDLRRNIVLRGVSAQELLDAKGCVIQLGPVCRVLVHRPTVPCMYNERKNGVPGMMESIWNEAGISCQVLVGGPIQQGDSVEILMHQQHEIDDGYQPPGYYIPPSKRTAAMVKEALAISRENFKSFSKTDPEGVERARAAYETVGLTFWPREKAE